MTPEDLQKRTKLFAIQIIKLVKSLQNDPIARVIGNGQLLRSGTAVAANYRSACRSRSVKDFISKIGIVVEEADETQLWIELLIEAGIVNKAVVDSLLKEATEITAIMTAAKNTAIKNYKSKK